MSHSLAGLMKWCEREEWREPFHETMMLHLGPPCAKAGVAIENLPGVVGDDRIGVLWGCIFEWVGFLSGSIVGLAHRAETGGL